MQPITTRSYTFASCDWSCSRRRCAVLTEDRNGTQGHDQDERQHHGVFHRRGSVISIAKSGIACARISVVAKNSSLCPKDRKCLAAGRIRQSYRVSIRRSGCRGGNSRGVPFMPGGSAERRGTCHFVSREAEGGPSIPPANSTWLRTKPATSIASSASACCRLDPLDQTANSVSGESSEPWPFQVMASSTRSGRCAPTKTSSPPPGFVVKRFRSP